MENKIKSFDELPSMLHASHIKLVLGISSGKVYQLMNSAGFPVQRFGKRMMVLKTDFVDWLEKNKEDSKNMDYCRRY